MRSRQRYSRSFSATAKSTPSNSSIALWSNHCRCTRNSLPGSSSRFTTSSRAPSPTAPPHGPMATAHSKTHPVGTAATVRSQPAVAERPRTLQFHPLELHLHAVDGVGRNFAVFRKQAQFGEALFALVEDLQRLAPGRLLAVVDLAQVEHRRCAVLPPRRRRFSTTLK